MGDAEHAEAFVSHWAGREGGAERANFPPFMEGLCRILGVPRPDPSGATTEYNDYVYERAVRGRDGHPKRIDLYKRGCFILEAKQSRRRNASPAPDLFGEAQPRGRRGAARGFDTLMQNARNQAEAYARMLPADHPWPPFILICDVGHVIEIYADFSGQGRNYTPFPDRNAYRVYLEDLRDPAIRARLAAIWTDPLSLDPARRTAQVTREVAARIAAVARALEAGGENPERVAMFLLRCLFTMFAEDAGLLPEKSFQSLLARCIERPENFVPLVCQLWEAMDKGGFAHAIESRVKRFNGEFFRDPTALPLGRAEIGELLQAASHDWRDVDPAIFGALLEQALDPEERKRLGAHYTPRAYVERLVIATIMEPLRADWQMATATAARLRAEGQGRRAIALVRDFHERLCATRVLDPACGTGNFLYVALELMKRLEGEVLETLLDLGGEERLSTLEGHTVDPHQFLGLEVNPRAAGIAELVLWIGHLQWNLRTLRSEPSEPVLKAYRNIVVRDAVLDSGDPIALDYREPRAPAWPEAEFIVGNPPFIGGKDIRARLGDAYAEALWAAHQAMNESADFVMYWWNHAASLLIAKPTVLRRFGFVTTNSITQTFQRRVVARHLDAKPPVSLVYAIPDHPWTRATPKAAAVRIAMSVAEAGTHEGILLQVAAESGLETDAPLIEFSEAHGRINADFTIGVDVTQAKALKANEGICSPGVKLHGAGFIVTKAEAVHLGLGRVPGLERHIRDYRNGRDLNARPRGVMVIDMFPLQPDEIRKRFPAVYQRLLTKVKPERDTNRMSFRRDNWCWFGATHETYRSFKTGLERIIVTVETSKHRMFQFLDNSILPDNMLVAIGSDDAFVLGVLSSRIHVFWALRAGGWLGMGNDPRYTKSRCFDPFPFPDATPAVRVEIAALAEEIDALRKRVLDAHPHLTLTGLYNVREALRAGTPLDEAQRAIHDDGLVAVLHELHTRLDAAVARAYGIAATAPEAEILAHLAGLNATRGAEEARGQVRWLRPDYQIPRFGTAAEKRELALEGGAIATPPLPAAAKRAFPARDIDQTASIMAALRDAGGAMQPAALARRFTQGKRIEPRAAAILEALAAVGLVTQNPGGYTLNL